MGTIRRAFVAGAAMAGAAISISACTGGLLTAEHNSSVKNGGGCGSTSVLSEDFNGADPGEVWTQLASGGATVGETGGEAVVTLPDGAAAGAAGTFRTQRFYNMSLDSVSVEVTSAADPATTASAYLSVLYDDVTYLRIYQQQGKLYFSQQIGGTRKDLASVPYSATDHRFWRFREDGESVHWETSKDGISWVSQAQQTTSSLFAVDAVRVELGATTEGGEANPGEARFDRINGGGPPAAKWCPINTIQDDFDDGTRGRIWKRGWTNPPMTVAETGGDLVLTLATTGNVYSGYESSSSYDLAGSSIALEVPATASTSSAGQTFLLLAGPGNDAIQMMEAQGQLLFSITVKGTAKPLGTVPYSPQDHAWWRVREAKGTLFWETAPDGKTWTVQQKVAPVPFMIDTLDVILASGTWQVEVSPGVSRFDNLNLPPQ